MAQIYQSLINLIGNTPLIQLNNIMSEYELKARLIAKAESYNPGGSVKDRAALAMIEDAEQKGLLSPGALIIEPTSGNTGVGLAWIASLKGYKVVLTMPETMSIERQKLLKALGAEIVLTPGAEGMAGAIKKAEELHDNAPGSIIIGQFDNPSNPKAHISTTAQEIWRDTDGEVDIFVAGVGTGGTLCGTARGLKAHNPNIKAIAVEPAESPIISQGNAGPHKIQGIGANFIPQNYDASVVDEVITVKGNDAVTSAQLLAKREGIFVGISSGAALNAAIEIAQRPENEGKTIVVLLPDTGERYLSTELVG
ncbi:MAG: cysteine synthase A [Muribaculaceae bacterium]|nr:cysteine synthase A [Muribaculaceae bacterium]